MEYEHDDHRRVHHAVREYLKEFFEQTYEDPDDGHFYVRYGSTVLEIAVEPYGPEDATIKVMAYCVQGVEAEEDLLLGLLELNNTLPLGAFSLVGEDVFFSYALTGRWLDSKSLLGAIAAVATVADDYDDRIVARFGGQTALERIQDTGGPRARGQARGEA